MRANSTRRRSTRSTGRPMRSTSPTADGTTAGRDETEVERADRQLLELLQELRVMQTGAQVLFAFLLGVPFTARFGRLGDTDRALYFVTLLLSGLAIIFLVAPAAWHRWLFELGDKRHIVDVSHRF